MNSETKDTEKIVIPDYAGLSNKELQVIFYKMKDVLTNLDENLSKCKIQKVVNTPLGRAVAYKTIPQATVDKFKSSEYYQVLHDLVNKLQPIVEVIEDCDSSCKSFADELR